MLNPHSIVPEAQMERLLNQVPQHGLTLGRPEAGVTVTEFANLQCLDCAIYTLALLRPIVNRWVRPGAVKLVLHPVGTSADGSVAADDAALAAAYQNKLWSFLYAFSFHREPGSSAYVTGPFLRLVAHGVPGLNVDEMLRDRSLAATRVELWRSDGLAVENQVTKIPTFIVLGPRVAPFLITGLVGLEQAIDVAVNT